MTPSKKEKVYELLGEGLSSSEIAKRLRVSVASVAACKANLTMRNQPKYFEVQGTFIVEARSREEAISATRKTRVPNTRVLSEDVHVDRLSGNDVENILS